MNEELLHRMRHSASHVMAEAVLEMFPEGKTAIGPAIEEGFYYDFDLPRPLTMDDLAQIEARMQERIAEDLPFTRRELPRADALKLFADQPYKVELIQDLPAGEAISIYTHGKFTDLCAGPHLDSTGQIGAVKLLHVAGAYWRGDERRPMLQRIYGTAWENQEQLEHYLWQQEEAARRDHRRLGKDLDLFSIHEEGGAGLACFHPRGARIKRLIEEFWYQEHERGGYELVSTPHIGKAELWTISGHLDFYRENMYSPMDIDGVPYYIKPMNCPYHILMYKTRLHSYRELPLRWAELGTVYRYERSGVLHGLLRVRGFTIDDAHIICRPDQVEDEILGVYNFSMDLLIAFGFQDFDIYLATRPKEGKAVGEPARWEQAQAALRRALAVRGLPYQIDEGGGAFYGPKIDIKVKDALGRPWQCTTIQFDFNLPERFDMTYIGEDGQEHRPYMVHRALLGSLERFIGCLIEHYGGAFPVWLAPVQVKVIPISDRHLDYARQVQAALREEGIRAEVDESGDRMQAKIRNAQLQKVPYMLVIGNREVETRTVSVRLRTEKDLGPKSLPDFMVMVKALVEAKEPHMLTLVNEG